MTNGGMYFYHDKTGGGHCSYYLGDNGKVYNDQLSLFKAVTMPRALKDGRDPGIKDWIKARIADMTGHPRIAKRHYDAWKLANDNF